MPSVACHHRRSDFISSEWEVDRGWGRTTSLMEIPGRCVAISYEEELSTELSEEGTSSLKRDFLISGRISNKHRLAPWRG